MEESRQSHDNKILEGVVRAMKTLENSLVREVNDLDEQIQQVQNLGQLTKGKRSTGNLVALEQSYEDNSYSAAASDSKTYIQCIIDRIIEFTSSRKFYQLGEAIDDAIDRIREHVERFPEEILEDSVFTVLRDGLNAHKSSLKTLANALENLKTATNFNEYTDNQQLKTWA